MSDRVQRLLERRERQDEIDVFEEVAEYLALPTLQWKPDEKARHGRFIMKAAALRMLGA